MNPDIKLYSVATRLGIQRDHFANEFDFLRRIYIQLRDEIEDLQHQVHLRKSEHTQAFYAMRALEPNADDRSKT